MKQIETKYWKALFLYSFNIKRFDDLNLQFPTIKEATKRYQMKQKMSRKTKVIKQF